MTTLAGMALFFMASGLLLAALCIPMIRRTLKPNAWYGVRTRATLHNERLWYDANAYAGRVLLVAALVWVGCSIGFALIPGITFDAYSVLMLIVVVAVFIPSTILLWRQLSRLSRADAPAETP